MDRRLRRQLSRNPELRELLTRHPAWTPTRTGSGHWKLTHTSGAIVVASQTPGGRGGVSKTAALMRRVEREAS